MEKGTPHCKLPVVKALIEAGQVRVTLSALSGGAALGLDFDGMIGVVMELTPQDFYKSMTHVRRPPHLAGRVPTQDGRGRGLPETDGHR